MKRKNKIKSTNLHDLHKQGLNYYDAKKPAKKADAILTADWHLRESSPICRSDDFWETQWRKVDFIKELAITHNNCPVIHAGDLFNYWKPSPMLLSETIKHLPKLFWTVYGNHDLPQHNLNLIHKSGVHVLDTAGKIEVLRGCHWGQSPKDLGDFFLFDNSFLVWHEMVYQSENPYGLEKASLARKLLRKYPDFDIILTGDNHTPFVERHERRVLVNPGSIFRMTAAQIDHKPRVYLYFSKTNEVEPVFLPINKDVINRNHLLLQEQRENRINVFISALKMDWQAELSFQDNVINYCKKNNIRTSVKSLILKSFEL
jgi:DNA repair exonuclease SbcCD nuclease subunit